MKAILVIDIPETIRTEYLNKDLIVQLWDKDDEHYIMHDICDLKPMPQKKEVEVNKIEDIMHTEYSIEDIYKNKYIADIRLATDKLIAIGYNACIDEILGGEE